MDDARLAAAQRGDRAQGGTTEKFEGGRVQHSPAVWSLSACNCKLAPRDIEGASDERQTRPPFLRIVARVVERKQQLLERLKEGHLGPHQHEEIERQLQEIDMTLDFLDEGELGETSHGRRG